MENVENSFEIDDKRPVNIQFIQEQTTLWGISDDKTNKTGNTAKIGFLIDDYHLRHKILKVRRR